MPTVYTKTVGTSSRDYSTIALAEADVSNIATSADLVANDEAVVFELYDDSVFTERPFISGGLTTDATRNVTYKAASGEKHDGTWSGVRVQPSSGTGHVFTVFDFYTVLEGIAIAQYASSATSDEGIRLGQSGGSYWSEGVEINDCLIWAGPTAVSEGDGIYVGNYYTGLSSAPVKVQNCVIWGWDRCGVHMQQYTNGTDHEHYIDIINCSFYDCGTAAIGVRQAATVETTRVRAYNNLALSCTLDFEITGSTSGTLDTIGDGNVSDNTGTDSFDAAPDGSGGSSTVDISADATDYTETTSTSPGAGDWAIVTDLTSTSNYQDLDIRLVDDADNDVLDLGVGPSSQALVPTTDILGNSRSGTTCDPGAFEAQSAGVTISGTATIPTPDATAGSVEYGRKVSGTADIPTLGASGSIDVQGGVEVTGTAAVPTPSASGSLVIGRTVTGTAQIPTIDAAGSITVQGGVSVSGTAAIPTPSADGSLVLERSVSGVASQPVPSASGSILVTGGVDLSGTAQVPTDSATGSLVLGRTVAGTATIPTLMAMGTISVGDNPLYQASPVPGYTWAELIIQNHLMSTWDDPVRFLRGPDPDDS